MYARTHLRLLPDPHQNLFRRLTHFRRGAVYGSHGTTAPRPSERERLSPDERRFTADPGRAGDSSVRYRGDVEKNTQE